MTPEPFLEYVRLRLGAAASRKAGQPRPWSPDPAIAARHFCNVIRDDDWTSREAMRIIQHDSMTREAAWAAAMTFRLYNRPSTLRALLAADLFPAPSGAAVEAALRALPEVFNTVAYRVTLKGGLWNIPTLSQTIYRAGRLAKQGWRPRERAELAVQQLQGELGIGPFLAYQVMQDLRWLCGPFEDEGTWCCLGGGAVRGLSRLTGTYVPQERVDFRFQHNTLSGAEQDAAMRRSLPILRELLPPSAHWSPGSTCLSWSTTCASTTSGSASGRVRPGIGAGAPGKRPAVESNE